VSPSRKVCINGLRGHVFRSRNNKLITLFIVASWPFMGSPSARNDFDLPSDSDSASFAFRTLAVKPDPLRVEKQGQISAPSLRRIGGERGAVMLTRSRETCCRRSEEWWLPHPSGPRNRSTPAMLNLHVIHLMPRSGQNHPCIHNPGLDHDLLDRSVELLDDVFRDPNIGAMSVRMIVLVRLSVLSLPPRVLPVSLTARRGKVHWLGKINRNVFCHKRFSSFSFSFSVMSFFRSARAWPRTPGSCVFRPPRSGPLRFGGHPNHIALFSLGQVVVVQNQIKSLIQGTSLSLMETTPLTSGPQTMLRLLTSPIRRRMLSPPR